MKIKVSKNALAGALAALWKLVSRMSPVEKYKSVLIVLENGTLRFHTCGPEETMEFTLNCEAEGAFRQIVHFDTLQKAVRSGKGKDVNLERSTVLTAPSGCGPFLSVFSWNLKKKRNFLLALKMPEKYRAVFRISLFHA